MARALGFAFSMWALGRAIIGRPLWPLRFRPLVGDGITDNTAVLQAKMAARMRFTIPPGRYLVGPPIRFGTPSEEVE